MPGRPSTRTCSASTRRRLFHFAAAEKRHEYLWLLSVFDRGRANYQVPLHTSDAVGPPVRLNADHSAAGVVGGMVGVQPPFDVLGLRVGNRGTAMCTTAGMSSISSCKDRADSPHTTARGARAHGQQNRVRGLQCVCPPVHATGQFVYLPLRHQGRQITGRAQSLMCLRRRDGGREAGCCFRRELSYALMYRMAPLR